MICFQQLEVLDLSNNQISDLIELEMCSSIIKLNLKSNLVSDSENITFLSGMTALKWLNLNENPIRKLNDYDELVKEKLPDLENLDKDEEILKTSNSALDESSLIEDSIVNNKLSIDCNFVLK
jgi:Leucine-rich repeat (LRR) protein